MTDATLSAIYGVRGQGKSTLGKEKIKGLDRVLAFDPQGEYAYLPGFKKVTWPDLAKEMAKPKFRLSYKPAKGSAPAALHKICDMILTTREPYADWMARRSAGQKVGDPPMQQITLLVEEMSISYPVEKLPADLWGMTEMVERGRHSGVNVIALTQRPASISTKFRGNCEEFSVFRLDLVNDVDAVCMYIGKQYRDTIRKLSQGHYIKVAGGQATPKRTQKP